VPTESLPNNNFNGFNEGFNEELLAAENEFANFHPPTTRSSASRWSNQSAPVKTSVWLSGK
jgi:hypothetical protein